MAVQAEYTPTHPGQAASFQPTTVKVWDPFVRIFHWSLVTLFVAAYMTGDMSGKTHDNIGYGVLALVAARVVWGLVGPRHARFSDVVRGPRTVLVFLRDSLRLKAPRYIGHNPAGGAMVLALIAVIAVICGSGVMMTLDAFWGEQWVEDLHVYATWTAIGLVVLHVAGVVLASVEHRENLVGAMFTGRKRP
jgi:cytochrome b